MGEQARDLAVERVRFGKVHQADRAAADLVLVGGADAALGGADLDPFAGRQFPVRVELAMQREDQRDVFRDLEIFWRHLDALAAQLVDLSGEVIGVEHHAVADHRQFAGAHDARRQQRQLEHLAVDDQRPKKADSNPSDSQVQKYSSTLMVCSVMTLAAPIFMASSGVKLSLSNASL